MENNKEIRLQRGAKIALMLLQFSIIVKFLGIYSTFYQLKSGLTTGDVILKIAEPVIFMAFVATFVSLIGLILFFYRKYLIVIILSVLALLWQMVYLYL